MTALLVVEQSRDPRTQTVQCLHLTGRVVHPDLQQGQANVRQGSVLGGSLTATGIPYREAARADGSSPLSIATNLSSQAEYGLVITQPPGPAAAPLGDVILNSTWP